MVRVMVGVAAPLCPIISHLEQRIRSFLLHLAPNTHLARVRVRGRGRGRLRVRLRSRFRVSLWVGLRV